MGTTNHIEIGGLYQTTEQGCLRAFKNDNSYRSEFRMKPGYVFTILETDIVTYKLDIHVRVLMSNTGNLQLVNMDHLQYFLENNLILRIA